MIQNNTFEINIPNIEEKIKEEKEEKKTIINAKWKEVIKLAETVNLPQIVIDSFKYIVSNSYYMDITSNTLIQRATQCYEKYSVLINKLPKDIAISFIYEYCIYNTNEDEMVSIYSYYKGYKDIFYLLHTSVGVFIVYNGISLQKDNNRYTSDYSWGYIDLRSPDDIFPNDKRVSGNTTQTAEVILNAVFPDDKEKLNLIPLFVDSFLIKNSISKKNSSFSKEDILNWYNNLNLIKRVCIEQKFTYREFGQKVGFGEGAIKNAAASGKISDQLHRAIEMYLEILKLKKENEKFQKLKELMKEIVSL